MTDELPTAARVSDPGIRALYRLENRWQAWLDVEAALARAQEELGIIPGGAAEAIGRAARLEIARPRPHRRGLCAHRPYDRAIGVGVEPGRRRAPWRLGALGRDDAEHHPDRRSLGVAPGAWRLPQPDRRGALGDGRSRRARRRHADRRAHPWPARSAGDFRLQAGGVDRRDDPPCRAAAQIAPRLFVAMLGGGAGTFASLGAEGPAVQAGMGKHLGMRPMRVPSRTLGDHLAENICLFGLLPRLRQDRAARSTP